MTFHGQFEFMGMLSHDKGWWKQIRDEQMTHTSHQEEKVKEVVIKITLILL